MIKLRGAGLEPSGSANQMKYLTISMFVNDAENVPLSIETAVASAEDVITTQLGEAKPGSGDEAVPTVVLTLENVVEVYGGISQDFNEK